MIDIRPLTCLPSKRSARRANATCLGTAQCWTSETIGRKAKRTSLEVEFKAVATNKVTPTPPVTTTSQWMSQSQDQQTGEPRRSPPNRPFVLQHRGFKAASCCYWEVSLRRKALKEQLSVDFPQPRIFGACMQSVDPSGAQSCRIASQAFGAGTAAKHRGGAVS